MSSINPLILTYNCGRELLPAEVLAHHLRRALAEVPRPELLVFSLQEIAPVAYAFIGGAWLREYFARFERAVQLATSPTKNPAVGSSSKDGENVYVNVITRNLGMTALMLFARGDAVERIRHLEVGGAGVGHYEMGNKGCVGVRFAFTDKPGEGDSSGGEMATTLTFLAAHLAPMEDMAEKRNEDWREIVRRLVFVPVDGKEIEDVTMHPHRDEYERQRAERRDSSAESDDDDEMQPLVRPLSNTISNSAAGHSFRSGIYNPSSYVFLAGDLNYRTSDTSPGPDDLKQFPKPSTASIVSSDTSAPSSAYAHLLEKDQLKPLLAARRTLHGFSEFPISFPPTYKYSNKARKMAADREEATIYKPERPSKDGKPSETKPLMPTKSNTSTTSTSSFSGDDENEREWVWAPHRWPSWCDRVLYLPPRLVPTSPSASTSFADVPPARPAVAANRYAALPLLSASDHRPVLLSLRAPLHPLPLAAAPPSASAAAGAAEDAEHLHQQHPLPPFQIDPEWRAKRDAARRRELAFGAAAYLGWTWEGNGMVLATVAGAMGGWAVVRAMLQG